MLIHQGGHSLQKAPELIVAHGTKHFPESKTRPRISEHCKNPKPILKNQKHIQESKMLPRFQNTVGFSEVFWVLGSIFCLWDVLWILGCVLGCWGVSLVSGTYFGFWDVFWILGVFLDSGTCFVPTSHRMNLMFSHKKGDCKK